MSEPPSTRGRTRQHHWVAGRVARDRMLLASGHRPRQREARADAAPLPQTLPRLGVGCAYAAGCDAGAGVVAGTMLLVTRRLAAAGRLPNSVL